jgi:hypothetical protein
VGKDSKGTCQAPFVLTAISLFGGVFTSDSMHLPLCGCLKGKAFRGRM